MKPITYKDSGVDIKMAAELVGDIGELRRRTEKQRSLMQAFGLFAASYDLSGYKEPVMVTGCDGVGTKLELLIEKDELEIAGKDLVAMNVNDILTTGGDPILFLDYIGVGKIDKSKIKRLIAGMVEYLEECGCILAGGETAEMPGIVPDGMIELSGFCVGIAEKPELVDPGTVREGDALVGYPSDGFHANGWSLIRKILKDKGVTLSGDDIRDLLAPTRLYFREVAALRAAGVGVKAMAHITGGGLPENLERLLGGLGARISIPRWDAGPVAAILRHVETAEAVNTFNMGFGWVAIVAAGDVESALECGEGSRVIGEVVAGKGVTVEVGTG